MSGHARLVLTTDTAARGCWCIRVGVYAGLTMKEARPQHKLTYVCSEGRTGCANVNGGLLLLRPLHREESCRYWTNDGEVAEVSEATCSNSIVT